MWLEKIKEIADGWLNDIYPPEKLKEAITHMAEERLAICRQCPENSINKGKSTLIRSEYCTKCGCPLAKKTKSPTSQCPLIPPKWEKILDLKEHEKLLKSSSNA